MSSELRIRLLGGFSLELNGKPVSGLPSRKAEALLAYLVCHKRPFPREVLADFLWDDRPQDQTLANLRSLLSGMRRKLGDFLIVTRQNISFNHQANYWLDVAAFTAQLPPLTETNDVISPDERSRRETAVSIYQGNFLDGFYVRESRRFEEWVLLERERLQRLAVYNLQQLVKTMQQQGQYAAGIEASVRLLEFDPLSEMAHRSLMLLLARSGQRNAALQQYDTCCRILDDELGVPPTSETTALYERIRSSQTSPLHNLPPQTTAFVGRESELAELDRLLGQPNGRFITLLGPGGIGKTRLALQTAHHIVNGRSGMFLHGIRFVPLNSIDSAQFLPTKIAESLSFSFSGSASPQEQLINYLRSKELLLILDNFEQLIGKNNRSVSLLTQILQEAPLVKLLVTSRTRLNAPGEHVFDMRGLPVPTGNSPVPAETYSAVRLFMENARRVRQDFAPSPDEMQAIVRICRLLDGMPLGIELAAAWARMLSCREIEAGIAEDLDFLQQTGFSPTERHASLRAAFAYSWRLLDKKAQAGVMQLAVFRGSFDRETAAQVTGIKLPLLTRLVDQCWVRRTSSDQSRYEMLTVMRQYAAEKLAQDGDLQTAVCQRHLDFFTQFLASKQSDLRGGSQLEALTAIGSQIEDIRSAVEWAIAGNNLTAVGTTLISLFYFYDTRSWFQEGAELFERGITAVSNLPYTPEQQRIVANLQAREGWFRFHLGEYEISRRLLYQSLETLRSHHLQADMVFTLNYLGAVARHQGAYETATRFLQEALPIAEQMHDQLGASIALNILGQVASLEGDFEVARFLCQQGLAIKRQIGDQWGMTYSLTYLGRVAQAVGDDQEAQNLFQESMAISESLGDKRGVAFALQNLGQTAMSQGNVAEADQLLRQSLDISREIGDRLGAAMTLAKLGEARTSLSEIGAARRLLIEGLHEALAIGSTPAMLDGILGTAVLHIQNANHQTALERLHYIATHSGSSRTQITKAHSLIELLGKETAVSANNQPIELYVQQILQMERTLTLP